MSWIIAMLLVPPFLLYGDGRHFRVWGVMMGSWLAGMLAVGWSEDPTPILAWIIIDIASAFLVLSRPCGIAQKLIGCTFAMMIAWHVGFALADHGNARLYTNFQGVLGWAQWAILMLWGIGDAGKAVGIHPWGGRHQKADNETIGAGGK